MPEKRKSTATPEGRSKVAKKVAKGEAGPAKAKSVQDLPAADPSSHVAYDPVHFIRSHSKNNDPADIQTQIWDVVFEPDPTDPSKTTTNVATCGGNAICIINVSTGVVSMKYRHKELKEIFYTLAWTTMTLGGSKTTILASGGVRGEVRLFHPKNKVCFQDWRPAEKKSVAVNSLTFHSSHTSWLFCGTSDGVITLWNIGIPSWPTYDGIEPVKMLRLFPDYGDVYNIAWTGSASNWILAGTAAGLVGYQIDDKKLLSFAESLTTADKNAHEAYKPQLYDFIMPESKRDDGENPIVDSLSVLSDWLVVNKCALHGLIYVWDLAKTLEELQSKSDADSASESTNVVELNVKLCRNLKWSDTDNFYMNLGCHKENGLIACGDDRGTIWLYDQKSLLAKPAESETSAATADESLAPVAPDARLAWPELQDDILENSRKVTLDKQKNSIIIDKVATSACSEYVVAVTSNNMVCIWHRPLSSEQAAT